ncbi:hypothetical protein FBQ81_03585 [Chloroflexi bacterium CFX6]|nr:hypothetical protein [Chloroflexi bacterium CFX6]
MLQKIASVLAFVIGAMAVVAGGKVLLGILPDYYVINWLPVYNYTVGVLTVLVTSVLIWINHKLAMPIAVVTFGVHTLVMLVLQTAYRDVVAVDSVVAMTVRMAAWIVILALMYFGSRRNQTAALAR